LDNNRVEPTNKSRVKAEEHNQNEGVDDGKRYLKCKYLLVKVNN
jgi:hypothetical protein